MSSIKLILDGAALTVDVDGVITGNHALVDTCNLKVRHTCYSPDRQQSAVLLLQRLGATAEDQGDNADRLHAYPLTFDPFVWY